MFGCLDRVGLPYSLSADIGGGASGVEVPSEITIPEGSQFLLFGIAIDGNSPGDPYPSRMWDMNEFMIEGLMSSYAAVKPFQAGLVFLSYPKLYAAGSVISILSKFDRGDAITYPSDLPGKILLYGRILSDTDALSLAYTPYMYCASGNVPNATASPSITMDQHKEDESFYTTDVISMASEMESFALIDPEEPHPYELALFRSDLQPGAYRRTFDFGTILPVSIVNHFSAVTYPRVAVSLILSGYTIK